MDCKAIGEFDRYNSLDDKDAIVDTLHHPDRKIQFKTTECIVGFLVYVVQTYTAMVLVLQLK